MQIRRTAAVLSSCAALTLGGVAVAAPASADHTQQNGLVNVNVEGNTIQVPIGIAANLCDINANILAAQERDGGAECDAVVDQDTRGNAGGNGNFS